MKAVMVFSAAVLALSATSGVAIAADAQQLLKDKMCLSCHTLDKKLVGPAYKDVAAKYKPQKDAETYLVKKIMTGSTGVWGQIPMPPNTTVKEDDAHTLAKFILGLK